jgi:hypothetical protein
MTPLPLLLSSSVWNAQVRQSAETTDDIWLCSASGVLPPVGYRKTTKAENLVFRPHKETTRESDEDSDNGRRKIIRSNKDDIARARRRKQDDDSGDEWD